MWFLFHQIGQTLYRDRSGREQTDSQLADDNSILNELKRIIAKRCSCDEFGNDAGFELISCGYPLLYKRGRNVLVAINPMNEEKTTECSGEMEQLIYSYNGGAVLGGGKITVKPVSAAYIRLEC